MSISFKDFAKYEELSITSVQKKSLETEGPIIESKYESKGNDLLELEKRVDELKVIASLAETPQDFTDEVQRVQLFARLSYGLRKAGEALAKATYLQRMAKVKRKEAEAVAALDEFVDYVESQKNLGREVKVTDSNRAHYTNMSKNVLIASEHEAMMDAMVELISTIKFEITQGISTLRALAYGPRDSSYLSNSSDGKGN